MSDLQDALDYFDDTGDMPADVVYAKEMLTVLEAARLVADPNIEAAEYPILDTLAMFASKFLGITHEEAMKCDDIKEAARLIANAAVAAALTPPDQGEEE